MLINFILAIILFFLVLLAVRWFLSIKPRVLVVSLKWFVLLVLVGLSAFLIITGRFGAAVSFLIGAVVFGWRLLNFFPLIYKAFHFINMFQTRSSASKYTTGRSSEVESQSLRMTLDHDSGRIDGYIIMGRFSDNMLSSLTIQDLLVFRGELIGRVDCLALLETYLDQSFSGWRMDNPDSHSTSANSGESDGFGPMTEAEALKILGLTSKSNKKLITQAYRTLISKMHPDVGGSEYLTAKINQARDILMKLPD